MNATTQKMLRRSEVTDFLGQDVHQLSLSIRTTVGKGVLKVIPDSFVRV